MSYFEKEIRQTRTNLRVVFVATLFFIAAALVIAFIQPIFSIALALAGVVLIVATVELRKELKVVQNLQTGLQQEVEAINQTKPGELFPDFRKANV